MIIRISRKSGSGRDTLVEVQEWSGDPPGGRQWSGVVGRPSQKSESGREWSEDHPGGAGVVGRPT